MFTNLIYAKESLKAPRTPRSPPSRPELHLRTLDHSKHQALAFCPRSIWLKHIFTGSSLEPSSLYSNPTQNFPEQNTPAQRSSHLAKLPNKIYLEFQITLATHWQALKKYLIFPPNREKKFFFGNLNQRRQHVWRANA